MFERYTARIDNPVEASAFIITIIGEDQTSSSIAIEKKKCACQTMSVDCCIFLGLTDYQVVRFWVVPPMFSLKKEKSSFALPVTK
jgi:hypothetical protein